MIRDVGPATDPDRDVDRDVDAAAAEPATPPATASNVDAALLSAMALVIWFGVVYLGRTWGLFLELQGRRIELFTPPILGGYRFERTAVFWIPILTAVVLIGALPSLAGRLGWRATLIVAPLTSLAWWVALASVEGAEGFTKGLSWQVDYANFMPAITADPVRFLSGFAEGIKQYGIQMRGHPPGLALVFAAMDALGLRGGGWAAALILAGAMSSVIAVLVAVREVADETVARRAMPFVVLAPAALWIVMSYDALYLAPSAWFVTLLILALRRTGRRSDLFALGAGLLATVTIMFSYGLVLMGVGAMIAAVAYRRYRPIVIATVAALVGTLAFVPFGFWWLAGLGATHEEYFALGLDRPYDYFLVNNLSAWALALGPATAVALVRLRDRRLWILVGGGLAAALIADLSGLSNAEVERIWLPFTIWVIPAAAVLGGRVVATRVWLAVQAGSALVLTALISPYW